MDIEAEVVSVDTGESVDTYVEPTETVETVEEHVETEEPATQEKVLVELPDGRKLEPEEVAEEYKKLQAEFTRKSQRLAEIERGNINNNKPTESSEEWIPETYEEILQKAEERVLQRLESKTQYEQQITQQAAELVDNQLAEIKKENPSLNEALLFQHAMKYGFQDLKMAHTNYKEMHKAIKSAQEITAQNIQKRNAEPISGGVQSGITDDRDVYDPTISSKSLMDAFRSIK